MKYSRKNANVEAIEWDGKSETANEFIGEAYGEDWEYVGKGDCETQSIVIDPKRKSILVRVGEVMIKFPEGAIDVWGKEMFSDFYFPVEPIKEEPKYDDDRAYEMLKNKEMFTYPCGCKWEVKRGELQPVNFNPFNGKVLCHMCGTVYEVAVKAKEGEE